MNVKQKQIEFLERFIGGDMGVIERFEHGLCANLRVYTGADINYRLYREMVSSWDKWSGCTAYPIWGYYMSTPKYKGEQLRLRMSLAKHLLEGLRDD